MLLIKNQMHFACMWNGWIIVKLTCFIVLFWNAFFFNHTFHKKMWSGEDTSYIVQMEMVGRYQEALSRSRIYCRGPL